MRVVIGPVATSSATAWIDHARATIARLDEFAPAQCDALPDPRPSFSSYVEAWGSVVDAGVDPFLWEAELEPEQVMFDLHAWHKVAETLLQRAQEAGSGYQLMPATAQEFHRTVLRAIFDALALEGPQYESFVQHLAMFWPGQEALVV